MASEWRRSQADERGFHDRLPVSGGRSSGTGSLTVAALKQRKNRSLTVATRKQRKNRSFTVAALKQRSRLGNNAKHPLLHSRGSVTAAAALKQRRNRLRSRLGNNAKHPLLHSRGSETSVVAQKQHEEPVTGLCAEASGSIFQLLQQIGRAAFRGRG